MALRARNVMIGGLFLRSLVLCFKLTSDWAVFFFFLNCKSEIWLNLKFPRLSSKGPQETTSYNGKKKNAKGEESLFYKLEPITGDVKLMKIVKIMIIPQKMWVIS